MVFELSREFSEVIMRHSDSNEGFVLFSSTGLVRDLFYVTGLALFPVYLLDGRKPV